MAATLHFSEPTSCASRLSTSSRGMPPSNHFSHSSRRRSTWSHWRLPNPERSRAGRVRRALPAIVGIVLSLALLAWAARGVRLDEVWRQIRAAHPLPLAIAVILATLTFPLRLIRWRVLLPDE